MKKKNICWTVIIAVAVIGVAMATVGFIFGAKVNIMINKDGINIEEINDDTEKKYKFENIESLNVNSISKDIIFIPSDSFEVQIPYNIKNEKFEVRVENGILNIREKSNSINFGFFFREKFNTKVFVYFPKDTKFKNVLSESTSGSINIEGVTADKINLKTVSGKIDILNCKAVKSQLFSTSGKTSGSNNDLGRLEIRSVSGDVELSNIKSTNITAKTTSGKINLSGDILGKTEASSVSGNVQINIVGNKAEYAKQFNSISGGIFLNGDKQGNQYSDRVSSNNSLIISTTSGKIEINFNRLQDSLK